MGMINQETGLNYNYTSSSIMKKLFLLWLLLASFAVNAQSIPGINARPSALPDFSPFRLDAFSFSFQVKKPYLISGPVSAEVYSGNTKLIDSTDINVSVQDNYVTVSFTKEQIAALPAVSTCYIIWDGTRKLSTNLKPGMGTGKPSSNKIEVGIVEVQFVGDSYNSFLSAEKADSLRSLAQSAQVAAQIASDSAANARAVSEQYAEVALISANVAAINLDSAIIAKNIALAAKDSTLSARATVQDLKSDVNLLSQQTAINKDSSLFAAADADSSRIAAEVAKDAAISAAATLAQPFKFVDEWNVAINVPNLSALSLGDTEPDKNKFWRVNTAGTSSITGTSLPYVVGDGVAWTGTKWVQIKATDLQNQFDLTTQYSYLFRASVNGGLTQYINQASGGNWLSGNKAAFIAVTPGHTIRIQGRDGLPNLKDNVWMNGNNIVVGTLPNYLNGTWGASRFNGDIDIVVPAGATYLYCFYITGYNLEIIDLTASVSTYRLKTTALPSSVNTVITEAVRTANIDLTVSGGSNKVADANKFKDVYGQFNTTPLVLFDASVTAAYDVYILQGGDSGWRTGNKSAIVPVIPGHTIKIEGRDGFTGTKDNVWLTSDAHVVNQIPAFLNTTWTASRFTQDVERVVPAGATYLYVYFQAGFNVKITDLSVVGGMAVKTAALPTEIQAVPSRTTALETLAPTFGAKQKGKIVLPRYIDVAIGRDANLYLDAVTNIPDGIKDNVVFAQSTSNLVKTYTRNIKFKPTGATANIDATFHVRDNNFTSLDSKLVTYRTVPVTGGIGSKNLMFVGDSWVAIGVMAKEVFDLQTAAGDYTFTQIGTRQGQFATVLTEGRSGWTWQNYISDASVGSVTNAFMFNGSLNFAQYCATNGFSGIDVMVPYLGTNDAGFTTSIISDTGIANIIARAKTFMTAVWASYPNCKIILVTPAVGGIRFSDSNVQNYRQYNLSRLAKAYIDEFDEHKYHANLYVCNGGSWIDRENGYDKTSVTESDRIIGSTTTFNGDPVHGNSNGTKQVSDAIFSKIRSVLAGNP